MRLECREYGVDLIQEILYRGTQRVLVQQVHHCAEQVAEQISGPCHRGEVYAARHRDLQRKTFRKIIGELP